MKPAAPENDITAVEVTEISNHGITLCVRGQHLSLPYEEFPWFKGQPETKIKNVVEETPGHFHWPDLDIDLSEKIIKHPEKYPLRFNPISRS